MRICRQALPALVPAGSTVTVLQASAAEAPFTIRIDYSLDSDGRHTLRCGFAEDRVRPELIRLATEQGELSPIRLHMLNRFWLEHGPDAVLADPGPGESEAPLLAGSRSAAMLVQALLSGLPRTGVMVLVAAAYGLVYGLIGRINLAFGALVTLGGSAAVLGAVLAGQLSGDVLPRLAAALLTGAILAALYGYAVHRVVLAPLAFRSGQAVLVATLALAIALQEFLLVTGGPEPHYLPPLLAGRLAVLGGEGFVASITPLQIATVGIAALAAWAVLMTMRFTTFGRRWRAVSDDAVMAGLMGIAPARVLATSSVLASALAGLAGALVTVSIGVADITGATLLGLKALLAAVLGGIGSVEGAMLGGLLLGLVDSLWDTYLPIAHHEEAVLALLVLALILRPQGLLGAGAGQPQP